MNLSEMSTFVRDQAQTDSEDAPDSTLTVYARAAYRDIQSRVPVWPDKREDFTFTTVADQAYYTFNTFTATNLEFVSSVRDEDGLLRLVGQDDYYRLVTSSSGTASEATVYAVNDVAGLWLWPTPSAARQYTVNGIRSFTAWPSGSNEPDLPRGFDEVICWYMLGRYYQSQEDLEMAQMYMRDYEVALSRQIEEALRSSKSTAGPMIFGGDPDLVRMGYQDWVKKSVEG